ncbi:hypothetical protein OU415_31245 [Saccharopolyspora sp. WRP15-2]|uniref:DUF6199 domain-containing protein n=1 Tax=Saccharopolyspora oryzae TaxID=2997343 RepID=A0ABT4V9H7_9PSEU|nr:hypothetical protein [Saccharopolyspora oryzae]MDA3629942.1 hypothetical protein [Saccharopolyspora oryzae]
MAFVCVLLAVLMFVLGCVDQHALWRFLDSWRYSDPDANEPSGAAFVVQRLGFFVAAGGFVYGAVVLSDMPERPEDSSESSHISSSSSLSVFDEDAVREGLSWADFGGHPGSVGAGGQDSGSRTFSV